MGFPPLDPDKGFPPLNPLLGGFTAERENTFIKPYQFIFKTMPITEERKLYNKKYKADYKNRIKRISITLSNAEYKELERQAKNENIKINTLVKNMAFAYHQKNTLIPEPIKAELQELRFLLRNVANNINQIAHHSNTIQRLADENGLLLEIQKMEQTIYAFVSERLK